MGPFKGGMAMDEPMAAAVRAMGQMLVTQPDLYGRLDVEPNARDDGEGAPVLIVLTHDEFTIVDPFTCECGRFGYSPSYYGLSLEAAKIMRDHNQVNV